MTERIYFQVTDGPLSVRSTPSATGVRVAELPNGTLIEVEAGSRTEAGGFIWWKHKHGWSAEGSVTAGSNPFMRRTQAPDSAVAVGKTRHFRVVNGPVSVRVNPDSGSSKTGELPNGTIIEALSDDVTVSGGFRWVRHARGWSALGRNDNSAPFMLPTSAPEPAPVTSEPAPVAPVTPAPVTPAPEPVAPAPAPAPQVRYFRVVDGPVSIREQANPNSKKLGELSNDTIIEVIPTSRTVNGEFVYWQHDKGWSAERRLTAGQPFMVVSDTPPPAPVAPHADPRMNQPDGSPIQFFEVVEGPISIRREPTLTGERLGQFSTGEQFEVIPRTRTENAGFVWWQHARGWSPERKQGSETSYLKIIPKITHRTVEGIPFMPVIVRHPVALTDLDWIQYYGNTKFAYDLRRDGKFWYNYCQALHGGFDYGSNRVVPIVAGVHGTVIDVNVNTSVYGPNYTRLKVGPYIFVYGHIANPSGLRVGEAVGPDTVIGAMDAGRGRQNHLHLEVRHGLKILNPLELMTEERQAEITRRYSDYQNRFYRSATWTLWQTPYDQPILNLQARGSEVIIGPHAR
jgi:hypothetical protein